MPELRPFHLAVPVHDLNEAREFYNGILGCPEGRSAEHWVDFDLFGHQFVCHLQPVSDTDERKPAKNDVDGVQVPIPHYGVALSMSEWRALADRLDELRQPFLVPPVIRFAGQPGEQGTFFITDPSGNALEFKGFDNLDRLFSS